MKKILTLTDFSQVANFAVAAATKLAKENNAQLEILHVLKRKEIIQYELDADPQLIIRNRKNKIISAKLDQWRKEAIDAGVTANLIVAAGNLIDNVTEVIAKHNIDLIVMGSTGIDESEKYWGTTTQEVVRNVEVPTLVIKSGMIDYKMDNIVFASDLDKTDQDVLQRAIKLLKPAKDAVVHLMSVNTSSFFTQPSWLMKSVFEDFEQLVAPLKTRTTFYNDYSVDAGIRHYLDDTKPDILVMSNRNRNPIKDYFISNPAVKAVGQVKCPVLILK